MVELIDPSSVSPAPYNPRKIDDSDFAALCDSVERLGVIVPIIINRKNGVIIAGHQRQKAALKIGMNTIPCFYADNVSYADEVLFNQIHNGTDFDQGITTYVSPQTSTGFTKIRPEDNFSHCQLMPVVNEVAKLLTRYGNVLSCVASRDGEVFKSPAYAHACRVLRMDANCYVVDKRDERRAREAFGASYGVFSYDHLTRNTWVQGLAQRYRRSTDEEGKRHYRSRLYEQLVIPNISKSDRVLDFGCGKGQYADSLSESGFNIDKLEFYHNDGKRILVGKAQNDIKRLVSNISEFGLYDSVVLDSVLNSVDSLDAETAVIGSCSALLKTGGQLFMSGRRAESAEKMMKLKHCGVTKGMFEFLDGDGLSARFRNGCFYYQKYHTDTQITELADKHGFKIVEYLNDSTAWRCRLTKESDSEFAAYGIEYEFSLPYPGGRYDFSAEVMQAIKKAVENGA